MNILKKYKLILIIIAIAISFVIVFSLMPKPIDMDLEKIGKGKKAIVFIYDANLAISNQQASEMIKARAQVGDQAVFLVAKIGNPKIEDFKNRYQARPPYILIFDEQGELLGEQIALMSASELIEKLKIK